MCFIFPIRVLNRIATIASVVNRVPAGTRAELLAAINESGLTYAWSSQSEPPMLMHNFMSHHLARDIRVTLANPHLFQVVAGYSRSASDTRVSITPPRLVQVWIRLVDGTWLRIMLDTQRIGALWTVRMVISFAVLATGIVLLAMCAAHKVTAPLRRFATAAQRLGTDVNAPPMSETGPIEIREAAHAFNQMQARIRRFVEDRTLMLAAISHDLRTALTRLKLRTEFIPDGEQRTKALADLDEMDGMLNATLSFAREEASAEPSTRVDLAVLLQSLCDELSDAGQQVTYAGPPHLAYHGHPIALRRVFSNLIINATKYGREANVHLTAPNEAIEITIGDRGPGIPPELREHVFAPFFRVEPSRSRATGGTGLGLTVVRTLTPSRRGHSVER
jgi:signal transduction histidine kinase